MKITKRNSAALALAALVLALAALVLVSPGARAQGQLMVRSTQEFPETMLTLQEAIKSHGYTVSRVQRIDEGLNKLGFKTDKYRVVFFGKAEENRELSRRFPELIPYLPLNFTLFAEQGETLITTLNPLSLTPHYNSPELNAVFSRWEQDLRAILNELRKD